MTGNHMKKLEGYIYVDSLTGEVVMTHYFKKTAVYSKEPSEDKINCMSHSYGKKLKAVKATLSWEDQQPRDIAQ